MAIALRCPHCAAGKVETLNHVWYIQGFLLFARYGSQSIIGCTGCVRKKTLVSLALSSVMGWWCFPWGLGTPFVLLQNLVAVAGTSNDAELRSLLLRQGMDLDELEIDEHGRSVGDTRLVHSVLNTLHQMVWADGSADDREVDAGATIISSMLGDMVTFEQVHEALARPESPPSGDLSSLGPDAQLILMKAACAIAAADDVIEESEIDALRTIGQRLGLASEITQNFIDALSDEAPASAEATEVRAIAAAVLGVEPDASASEIRAAYKNSTVDAIQIVDSEERSQALSQLQSAYEMMLSA